MHTTFIPEVGYSINPHPIRMYQRSNGNYGTWTSMLAHTYNIGLRIRSLSKTNVLVIDESTKKRVTGSTNRMSEIYFGLVIPAKDFVKKPHANYYDVPSTKSGYQLIFRIPSKLNGFTTFDIGVRATGYTNTSSASSVSGGKANFQLVIGNSIYGSSN